MNKIKISLISGFLVGCFIGIIDIISKIIKWSFVWYEFYQALALSIIIVLIPFFMSGIVLFIIQQFIKIKKTTIQKIYFIMSLTFIILFYLMVLLHNFSGLHLKTQLSIFFTVLLVLIILSLFFLKAKKTNKLVQSLIKNKKKLTSDLFFIVIIFILFSLLLDIYYLNYRPKLQSELDPSKNPNVILIGIDTLRTDHLSLFGYHRNTSPNIDKFSENAAVFSNAASTSSWTTPGFASIFTGKYVYNHNATKLHHFLNFKEILIAEVLRDKGYTTAGFSSGAMTKSKYGLGQGFQYHHDRMDFIELSQTYQKFSPYFYLRIFARLIDNKIDRIILKIMNRDGERTSKEINKDVFEFLNKHQNQTFFLFIHYFDVHAPYNLGGSYISKYTNRTYDRAIERRLLFFDHHSQKVIINITTEEVQYLTDLYDSEINYLDKNFALLIKELEKLDLLDNTLIIITADHGEEFFEHGSFEHMDTVYEEIIHVPLIFYYPRLLQHKTFDSRVSIIDIFPTILDILNITYSHEIDGISLLPLMQKENYHLNPRFIIAEDYGREYLNEITDRAISYEEWKLIVSMPYHAPTQHSLFYLPLDPKEQNNLYEQNNLVAQNLLKTLDT